MKVIQLCKPERYHEKIFDRRLVENDLDAAPRRLVVLGGGPIDSELSEANKYAAGEWERAHAPHKLPAWLEKYHN